MGWKTINGRRYYYRCERDGGRVKTSYLGDGETAQLFALLDAQRPGSAREHGRGANRTASGRGRGSGDRGVVREGGGRGGRGHVRGGIPQAQTFTNGGGVEMESEPKPAKSISGPDGYDPNAIDALLKRGQKGDKPASPSSAPCSATPSRPTCSTPSAPRRSGSRTTCSEQ